MPRRSSLPSRPSSLFDNRQVRLACLLAIGARLLRQCRLGVKQVDDLFAELARLIEQTEIGRITDRLFGNGGVQDQLALVGSASFAGSDFSLRGAGGS